jgi:anti-sigma factor RsiW
MKLDDVLLMACVDGELSERDSTGLRQAIMKSARAMRRVALFQASRLPYRKAFEDQESLPVPATLTRKIEQLMCAARTNADGHP